MKVAVNKCYGGFSLSKAAVLWLAERGFDPAIKERGEMEVRVKELGEKTADDFHGIDRFTMRGAQSWRDGTAKFMGYSWNRRHHEDEPAFRSDPLLVDCVETLGDEASGWCAAIKITEIPDGVNFTIGEYDGQEWVEEAHQTW